MRTDQKTVRAVKIYCTNEKTLLQVVSKVGISVVKILKKEVVK
jgi:hypothetical protein